MNELSRHIECLLLKHDCVIVPGLGGFIAQYVPARRVEEENLFLPPYRSVGFNQQLSVNDGLLVQSYMQAYDTNYPESIRIIEDGVRQLKDTLENEGEYEIKGVGTLSMNIDGSYNFSPCQAGVLSPELYGLDSLLICHNHSVDANKPQETATAPSQKKINVKRTERENTISINREIVYYAASAVVAVFFYFLWATPVQNTKHADLQTASMVYNMLFEQPEEVTANQQPHAASRTHLTPQASQLKTNKLNKVQTSSKVNKDHEDLATVNQSHHTSYSLVLASAIPNKNATHLTEKLKKQGYPEAKVYKEGQFVRVIYGNYESRTTAQKALHRMRKNKAFADAWIIQIK